MLHIEMLSTGDEVLHGQIIDTNAAWLADFLFQQGFPMTGRTTVGDDLPSLIRTLKERSHHAEILIVNGGLGPTSDDLSAQAAAEALGVELIKYPEWIAQMEAYFLARGRIMPPINQKQAFLPEGAVLIDNPVGTACGFAIELNDCWLFFTPGVPSEFKVMVEQQILPRLRQRFTQTDPLICLRLTTFGCSESSLATQLTDIDLPNGVTIGYRSSQPIIELKLTGPMLLREEMEKIWLQIKRQVNKYCIYEGTEGIGAKIKQELQQRHYAIAVSEQFTAGLLSWQLNVAGLSIRKGELHPIDEMCSLNDVIERAKALAHRSQAEVVIAVGGFDNGQFCVALQTPERTYATSIDYQARHHSHETRQEAVVMLAQDMLRRWLTGSEVFAHYEWLKIIESS